jgi:hypothetical protein
VSLPGGRIALTVLAVGLLLYALFSLLDTVLHHNDESPTAKRWGDRTLSAFGVLRYLVLAGYCFSVAFSGPRKTSGQDSQQKAELSAKVLRLPAGWLWLGLVGVGLLVVAAFLVGRALRRSFASRFDRERMSRRAWRTAMVLGAIGSGGAVRRRGWMHPRRRGGERPRARPGGVNGAIRIPSR